MNKYYFGIENAYLLMLINSTHPGYLHVCIPDDKNNPYNLRDYTDLRVYTDHRFKEIGYNCEYRLIL